MAPLVPWNRFVRFNDAEGSIQYGEPILESEDADIAALARDGKLKVKVLEGSGPLSCKPTDKEVKVEKLLGPLAAKDVPLIYCIGLNYKAHSMSRTEIQVLSLTQPHSPRRRSRPPRLSHGLHQRPALRQRPRRRRAYPQGRPGQGRLRRGVLLRPRQRRQGREGGRRPRLRGGVHVWQRHLRSRLAA